MKEYHIEESFKRAWQKKILKWYETNKRNLPWRKKKNQTFYRIWISEVMLQQTQVSVVIPFYIKFIKKWPTLDLFFDASLEEILKIWQGMGYYKRAHNLYKAKEIIKKNPKLCINSSSLKRLPGIGEYISSAISAILKDEQCAVVDGNIKRILIRAFDLKKSEKILNKQILSLSTLLTPKNNNGKYCQSLMDLANLICKVKNPSCKICPIYSECKSKGNLLVKSKKFKVEKKMVVVFVSSHKEFFLVENSQRDLLKNLFCFPMSSFIKYDNNFISEDFLEKTVKEWMNKKNISTSYEFLGNLVHKFSHFHLKVLIVRLKLNKKFYYPGSIWLKQNELDEKPVSKLMLKIRSKLS